MNDLNLTDDPQYILRSVGKAISVSLETVETAEGLPGMGANEAGEVDRLVYNPYRLNG